MAAEDPNGELHLIVASEMAILKGAGLAVLKFMQVLEALLRARMQHVRLTRSQYTSIHQFLKDTGGDYTISNIPTQDPERIRAFTEACRKAGIAHCLLPDLDLADGLTQVAVRNRDLGKFQYLFEEFTSGFLSGGKRSFLELKNNTSNHYTIKNIPAGDGLHFAAALAEGLFEVFDSGRALLSVQGFSRFLEAGDPAEKKEALMEQLLYAPEGPSLIRDALSGILDAMVLPDAEKEKTQAFYQELTKDASLPPLRRLLDELEYHRVTYALLPDLNRGDGRVQVAVADANLTQFKEALRALSLAGRTEDLTEEGYRRSGEMRMGSYLAGMDAEAEEGIREAARAYRRREDSPDPKAAFLSPALKSLADTEWLRERRERMGAVKDPGIVELPLPATWAVAVDERARCCSVRLPGEEQPVFLKDAVVDPSDPEIIRCFLPLSQPVPFADASSGVPAPGTGEAALLGRDVVMLSGRLAASQAGIPSPGKRQAPALKKPVPKNGPDGRLPLPVPPAAPDGRGGAR